MRSEKVLICIIGKSPQIVTESLYFLVYRQGIEIDRVLVITTSDCYSEVKQKTSIALVNFYDEFKLNNKPALELYEAVDEFYENKKDSSLTALIYKIIQGEKLRGNNLHCIISGGRKTMSVDLAIALSIFGNESDKMYHVIASAEFVASQNYYPKSENEANQLQFYEKPFVRLKLNNFAESNERFEKLFESVQKELDSRIELPILEIYPQNRRIAIEGKVIQFQPLPFAVYMFYAKNAGKFIRGGKSFSDKHLAEIWETYTKYAPSYGHMQRVNASSLREGCVNYELVQKSISTIRNQILQALDNDILGDFYIINAIGNYADKKYGIKIPKNRVKIFK